MLIPRSILLCATSLVLICSAMSYAEDSADQPDNSKVNQRDQSTNELTAQDQGSSKGDLELTRKIRQEMVKQRTLSSDAKNIKVISIDGVVTLKGPVPSASEKKRIEKIAMRIAGHSKVISQIEIEQ